MSKYQPVLVAWKDVKGKELNGMPVIAPHFPIGQSTIDKFESNVLLVTSLDVAEMHKIPFERLIFAISTNQSNYVASIEFPHPKSFGRFVKEFDKKQIVLCGQLVDLEIHKHTNTNRFDAYVILHNSGALEQRNLWRDLKTLLIDNEFHWGKRDKEQLLIVKK